MQPDYDLRIRSMVKALGETILPAVDPSNKAAIEQAHILLGSLELLRQQIDFAHLFEVADIRSTMALARKLAGQAAAAQEDRLFEIVASATAVADNPLSRISELKAAGRTLRAMVSDMIEMVYADGDAAKVARVQAIVLADTKEQIGRERAFVAGANFDVFADDLLSIEDSLSTVSSLSAVGAAA